MRNILLLGDSIRMNYQEYVRENLKDIANVYYPSDNGKFCQYTLRYVHEWIESLSENGKIQFDIIHFNNGLWDVLRLSNEHEQFTSEEEYEQLLIRIVERIRFFCPDAKLIFALTTEVIEPGFKPGVRFAERRNSDIQKYNEIAKKVLGELDIEINDLWSISRAIPQDAYSDEVHFETTEGVKALGNQVIKVLMNMMETIN